MVPITSKSNELFKKLKKLNEKKYRTLYGEYVAEGKRWVTDARRICPQNISAVVCAQSYDYDIADFVLSDELFGEVANTENSQGILAVMKIPAPSDTFEGNYCLFLDRLRDPGNMGTVLRTACAAGFTDIVLRDCVDIYNPKVIRSSMTGIIDLSIHYCNDLESIKQNGYTVFAADLDGKNVFGYKNSAQKICLVIGNEANGIDKNILYECDCTLTIPMQEDMESLNAAVSAAILMYQLKYNDYKEN